MKKRISFSSLRAEHILVAISLLVLLAAGILLSSNSAFVFVMGERGDTSSGKVIGRISFGKNDIRHRPDNTLAWDPARLEQRIRVGDSVFTGGDSQMRVTLDDGAGMDLGENSLVRFVKINDLNLPNLAEGNFRVAVNGTMKIAIDGEVTEVTGEGSEIQVVLKKQEKPKVRLLKGAARVKTRTTVTNLVANKVAVLSFPSLKPKSAPTAVSVSQAPTAVPAEVIPHSSSNALVYTDMFYDFYESLEGKMVKRGSRRSPIDFSAAVSWTIKGDAQSVFAQLSARADFATVISSFSSGANPQGSGEFNKAELGMNFFRLSVDGKTWSAPASFQILAKPLAAPAPRLMVKSTNVVTTAKDVEVSGRFSGEFSNFVVEVSPDPDFPPSSTRVLWMKDRDFKVRIENPATVYVQARGVNEQQNVTAYSESIRINISRPQPPAVPRLATHERILTEGQRAILPWAAASRAVRYRVRITDEKDRVVSTGKVKEPFTHFSATKLGTFRMRIAGEDTFGQISRTSAEMRIVVQPKPTVTARVEAKAPRRAPASPVEMSQRFKIEPESDFLNLSYTNSRFSLEGATSVMTSQDQQMQKQSAPMSLMMGIRWRQWFEKQGMELSLATKAAQVSGSGGQPLRAEGRYHYRWTLPFNPFSTLNQSQISLIGGYEYYRNSSNGLFSPGYQLIKTGFSLGFPLWRRWDTGGEVLYGQGLESSHLYEVAGYLNYFVNKQMTCGIGYRVHLFEAGSAKVTPFGLPYREGFGEAHFSLGYYY